MTTTSTLTTTCPAWCTQHRQIDQVGLHAHWFGDQIELASDDIDTRARIFASNGPDSLGEWSIDEAERVAHAMLAAVAAARSRSGR